MSNPAATLILEDGTSFQGESFGFPTSVAGEVVFTTGMVGYPESLTDPSYTGQILIYTFPLIGNYGVSAQSTWESDGVKATAVIVSDYVDTPSHYNSTQTLKEWLHKEKIPGLIIKDTRKLAMLIREKGAPLGKIVFGDSVLFDDPNKQNLTEKVSTKKPYLFEVDAGGEFQVKDAQNNLFSDMAEKGKAKKGKAKKHMVVFDCGVKRNILKNLAMRDVKVTVVPWNYDIFEDALNSVGDFDGILVSNGPGDPKNAVATIDIIKKALQKGIPTFGICLGNQILALAAGGDTYKLPYGHRGQNQPCTLFSKGKESDRTFLSTQNHGYAVGIVPKDFDVWFVNANDGTNEGIRHKTKPFMSVQFHPESTPGPFDTEWIFDEFIRRI